MHRLAPRAILPAAFVCLSLALGLGACDDPLGLGDPEIAADSIDLRVAQLNADTPSAIDILTRPPGLRYPERSVDAQEWDVQLRRSGGSLILAPFTLLGGSRAAGVRLATEAFLEIDEAPRRRADYSIEPITLQEGATYFIRSRNLNCVKFGALKVVDLDVAEGTGRFAIRSNTVCDDERLPLPETTTDD